MELTEMPKGKILVAILLVLSGMMSSAQTSVWVGNRALWSSGSGTESDPYLIESAGNLAYLAYMVNKGFDTEGMSFRLTTDIDLNGSEDRPWEPILMVGGIVSPIFMWMKDILTPGCSEVLSGKVIIMLSSRMCLSPVVWFVEKIVGALLERATSYEFLAVGMAQPLKEIWSVVSWV